MFYVDMVRTLIIALILKIELMIILTLFNKDLININISMSSFMKSKKISFISEQ